MGSTTAHRRRLSYCGRRGNLRRTPVPVSGATASYLCQRMNADHLSGDGDDEDDDDDDDEGGKKLH